MTKRNKLLFPSCKKPEIKTTNEKKTNQKQ